MLARNCRLGKRASIRTTGEPLPQFTPTDGRVAADSVSTNGRFGARLANWCRSLLGGAASHTVAQASTAEDLKIGGEALDDPATDTGVPDAQAFIDCVEQRLAPSEPHQFHLDSSFARTERIAPLTRLRLRRHVTVTWPAILDPHTPFLETKRRLEILRAVLAPGSLDAARAGIGEALARAYLEEESEGRILALRGLIGGGFTEGPSIFREALRTGSDAERSLAVDGLVAQRRIDDLLPALEDRIEAIAAKAGLAYAGTSSRSAVREALKPHISEARLEAILSLLVGLRE
jgi:hypothetical protein